MNKSAKLYIKSTKNKKNEINYVFLLFLFNCFIKAKLKRRTT